AGFAAGGEINEMQHGARRTVGGEIGERESVFAQREGIVDEAFARREPLRRLGVLGVNRLGGEDEKESGQAKWLAHGRTQQQPECRCQAVHPSSKKLRSGVSRAGSPGSIDPSVTEGQQSLSTVRILLRWGAMRPSFALALVALFASTLAAAAPPQLPAKPR